ncbi:MAG: hypothetical protein WB780_00570 [Candidatus Acidiferrales bacterium]
MADPALFKKIYRILSGSTLLGLLLTVGLMLHKSPAPEVAYDPAAAARVEKKFQAADEAKAAGQPAKCSLIALN